MGKYTFSDIQKTVDQQYGQLEIDLPSGKETVLRSPMRLADKARTEAVAVTKKLITLLPSDEESGAQTEESDLEEILPLFSQFILAVGDANTKELVSLVKDDPGMLVHLFKIYQDEVSLGE